MTEAQLIEAANLAAEELAESAVVTPGPWELRPDGMTVRQVTPEDEPRGELICTYLYPREVAEQAVTNLDYIADVRQRAPQLARFVLDLLNEVQALRGMATAYKGVREELVGTTAAHVPFEELTGEPARDCVRSLKAQVEQMTAVVEAAVHRDDRFQQVAAGEPFKLLEQADDVFNKAVANYRKNLSTSFRSAFIALIEARNVLSSGSRVDLKLDSPAAADPPDLRLIGGSAIDSALKRIDNVLTGKS